MNILIVDDHPLVCAALENVIEENFENVVVEQAFNAKKRCLFWLRIRLISSY